MESIERSRNQIISYHILRMMIGLIGVALPLILFIGRFVQGGWVNLENSISAYYYTGYRDIFVGFLFVLGFFLLSYRGKDWKENWFANSGFLFALGVALFPCKSEIQFVVTIHFVCAGALFSMFATFSLWLFRRSFCKKDLDNVLKRINRVYIITGLILAACVIDLLIFSLIDSTDFNDKVKPIFIIETVGLVTFAYAWFTRAHFLWRDPSEYGSRLYMFYTSSK